MAWLKLDDQFADHPKIVAAGPLAGWLHVCGMLYCARLLTDGFIPAGQVRKLADIDNAADLADRLVEVGLWDRVEGGYQVHDYLEYNPSRAKVLADREATKARVDRFRERKAEERNADSNAVTTTVTNAVTDTVSNASCNGVSNAAPVPVPVPHPVTPKKSSVANATARPRVPKEPSSEPFQVWSAGCEIAGVSVQEASDTKDRQMGKIKQLLRRYSRDDLVGCFAWLHDQRFEVDRGIDWFRVEQRIDSYITAGRPGPKRKPTEPTAELVTYDDGTKVYVYR